MIEITETEKIEVEIDSKIFSQVGQICKAVNHSIDGFINNAIGKEIHYVKQLIDEVDMDRDLLMNEFPETLNSLKKIFELKNYSK